MSKKYNVLVCCHNSLLYLTGAFLRFSNSNDGSTANSFPALFLKALVHLALRGFFFFLKFLWHFERQNLNIWKIIIRFVEYSIKRLKLKRLKISCQMAASTLLTMRFYHISESELTLHDQICWIPDKRSILKRLRSNCQLPASILLTNVWDFNIFQNLNLLCNHFEQTGHLFPDKQVNHRRNTFQPSFQGTVTRPGPLGNSIKRAWDLLNYFLIFQRFFFSV